MEMRSTSTPEEELTSRRHSGCRSGWHMVRGQPFGQVLVELLRRQVQVGGAVTGPILDCATNSARDGHLWTTIGFNSPFLPQEHVSVNNEWKGLPHSVPCRVTVLGRGQGCRKRHSLPF